jgi:hypothetical protein
LIFGGTRTWIKKPPQGVFIETGTKANILDRKFLEDGNLVEPYAANSYDMERDGAVEVVLIKIQDGPKKNLEGWIPHGFVSPTHVMP